jgi:hypothetical protein
MVSMQSTSLRRLGHGRGDEVRFGRFLANPKVTTQALVDGWSNGISAAVAGRHILALQDTTELHFATTAERRRGLGVSGKGSVYGLQVHPVLAIDADSGVCHGLAGGVVWTRNGRVSEPHRRRRTQDKESYRWYAASTAAKEILSDAAQVTMIGDSEADHYPLYAWLPEPNHHFLVRSCRDRMVAGGGTLYPAIESWPVSGARQVMLRERASRPARQMRLVLRYGEITLKSPAATADKDLPKHVTVRAVDVRQVDAEDGQAPVHWRLLTSHEVDDEAAAWRIVDWYGQRWHIEQLFRTMKSKGLAIEESQVTDAQRLEKLAAIATRAACTIMQLVQARDGANDQKAIHVFPTDDVQVLRALLPTVEGKTKKQQNPHPPDSLAWAAWIIARLGGWSGYASYRPPGPITFHNGLKQFNSIARGFRLRDV